MCPLYDRLLALLTNIKLGWKHSSLLRKFVTYIRKKFYNIETWMFLASASYEKKINDYFVVFYLNNKSKWNLAFLA